MILNQWIHHHAIGGETWHHVEIVVDEKLPVQDVVIGVVAVVNHVREVDHKPRGDAMVVGASIGVVGRQAVEGQKFVLALTIDNDASASAFHVGRDVHPAADEVQVVILHRVRVNRDGVGQHGPVGVLWVLCAAL